MNDSPHYKRLAYLWAATILCSFPVLLLGVGNLLLAVVPQAQEFLRAFNDGIGDAGFYPLRQFLVLELVLFLWSLSVWYTCRLLLGVAP